MSVEEDGEQSTRNLYQIEEDINFLPDEHLLQNVKTGETVTLLSTAAECFKILIDEQGRIVSRKEMKEKVWGKRGVVVSSNTFYQNMLNLRRGLEKVGAGSHLIATYYGKGVGIDNGVHIKRVAYNVTGAACPENMLTDHSDETVATDAQALPENKITSGRKERMSGLMLMNAVLFLVCIALFALSQNIKRENYFSQYTKTPYKVKTCSVFTDPAKMDEGELKDFLTHNTPDCEEGETLYLSSVYPVKRMSVIRCTGHFLPGDECESDYYLE
ncbi:winged helix-turn-helix domain-containing protein [Enterobacter sp. NFIX58]|uniref:winged helix-turn-helix domain-containing protein n=1 Tax=Enterobacter sp. NFIX58 TaxID=1566251 RepID=UPI0008B6B7A6|nr:winged helix-turn-helix domain-containing protein [Enterobacter sp. NFIX58]SEP23761.1 Transcriptional regulatory protein, C terminal [Enterobacter sp. NFIX58]